jgi:hypothetical protein
VSPFKSKNARKKERKGEEGRERERERKEGRRRRGGKTRPVCWREEKGR